MFLQFKTSYEIFTVYLNVCSLAENFVITFYRTVYSTTFNVFLDQATLHYIRKHNGKHNSRPNLYFNVVVDGFDSTVTMDLRAWALAVFQNEQVFVSHTFEHKCIIILSLI